MPIQYKLKGLIAENGLSQQKVADILGITLRAFNDKINGKSDFTLTEATMLSDFFSEPVENIFLGFKLTQTKLEKQ